MRSLICFCLFFSIVSALPIMDGALLLQNASCHELFRLSPTVVPWLANTIACSHFMNNAYLGKIAPAWLADSIANLETEKTAATPLTPCTLGGGGVVASGWAGKDTGALQSETPTPNPKTLDPLTP